MPLFKLNRKERTRLTIFLSSFLIAVFAWLFFSLSNRYDFKVNAKLNYVDPPLHKAYRPIHDDTVSLLIEGTGWQLLFSRLQLSPPVLNVSLKPLNRDSFITLSSQIRKLNQQLENGQKIVSISPDTLFFDFSVRASKKVPVSLVYKISYEPQFRISGPIKITPDSVMVRGAPEEIKAIKSWKTEAMVFAKVNSSMSSRLMLRPPENNIDIIPQQVTVEIPVSEFTEKVLDIPIEVLNNTDNDLTLLPEKVKVTFLVALNDYSKMERDSFQAVVDFKGWKDYKYRQLPIKFRKYPAFIKILKIEPQVVDFIIRQ